MWIREHNLSQQCQPLKYWKLIQKSFPWVNYENYEYVFVWWGDKHVLCVCVCVYTA